MKCFIKTFLLTAAILMACAILFAPVIAALQPAIDSLPPDSAIYYQPGTIGQGIFWLCQMVAGAFLTWLSTVGLKRIRGVTEAYTMILSVLVSGFMAWAVNLFVVKVLHTDIGLNVKLMMLVQWSAAAIWFKAQRAGQLWFKSPQTAAKTVASG